MKGFAAIACVVSVSTAVMSGSAATSEIIDRVMAVVDGQPITLSDVDAALAFQLVTPPSQADPLAGMLDRLIDRALMLAEAERYRPMEPAPEQIDAGVAAIQQRLGTAAALDQKLAAVGLLREHLRRWIRDDLRIRTYLDERFGGSTQPRDAMIRDWLASLRRRADITTPYVAPSAPGKLVNW